jgi:hypothetical protein
MRRAFLVLLFLGCSNAKFGKVMGAGVSTGVGATVTTAAALAASAGSRAMGGCYAICQQGEVCNATSGLCDTLPCHGLCAPGEKCDPGFFGDTCVQSESQSVSSKAQAPASGLNSGAIHIENKPELDDRPPVPAAAMP